VAIHRRECTSCGVRGGDPGGAFPPRGRLCLDCIADQARVDRRALADQAERLAWGRLGGRPPRRRPPKKRPAALPLIELMTRP
jgi:hypothetical protein